MRTRQRMSDAAAPRPAVMTRTSMYRYQVTYSVQVQVQLWKTRTCSDHDVGDSETRPLSDIQQQRVNLE